MISVVSRKQWEYHKVGIDMSSGFDTINRTTILNLLSDAGCSEDEIRLVRFLLSNTKLKVRVNSTLSAQFESTNGSFQGDSLSGVLFTLTLAGALNHLRVIVHANAQINRPILPISNDLMPLEEEYSDDVDFFDTLQSNLENLLPLAEQVLGLPQKLHPWRSTWRVVFKYEQ